MTTASLRTATRLRPVRYEDYPIEAFADAKRAKDAYLAAGYFAALDAGCVNHWPTYTVRTDAPVSK